MVASVSLRAHPEAAPPAQTRRQPGGGLADGLRQRGGGWHLCCGGAFGDSRPAPDSDMEITVHLPDDLARRLRAQGGDLSRRALEALAADAYRTGAFTLTEVQALLGLDSRWVTEQFLHDAGAFLAYDAADLDADRTALRDTLGS